MSRILPLTLAASLLRPDQGYPGFEISTEVGAIRIRGYLSTGSRGWSLRAEAARRRSVITVHVTAIEAEEVRVPDLERYAYEAVVWVGDPGRYSIRVAHAFVLRGSGGYALPRPVHEETLSVP